MAKRPHGPIVRHLNINDWRRSYDGQVGVIESTLVSQEDTRIVVREASSREPRSVSPLNSIAFSSILWWQVPDPDSS
jgi:hypothetical protein